MQNPRTLLRCNCFIWSWDPACTGSKTQSIAPDLQVFSAPEFDSMVLTVTCKAFWKLFVCHYIVGVNTWFNVISYGFI